VQPAKVLGSLRNVAVRRLAPPDNLVQVAVGAEKLIEYGLDIVRDVLTNVDVDRPILCKKLSQEDRGFVELLHIRIKPSAPRIAVRLLLDDGWSLRKERRLLPSESGWPGMAAAKEKSAPASKGGSMYIKFTLPANSGSSDGRTNFLSPQMSRLRHCVSRPAANGSSVRRRSWALSFTVSMV
jgi:hypothetical protein